MLWTDRDGQENETIAQYRSLDRLKLAGGDWDESDAGWWAYVDSDTQKRIEPHGWKPATSATRTNSRRLMRCERPGRAGSPRLRLSTIIAAMRGRFVPSAVSGSRFISEGNCHGY